MKRSSHSFLSEASIHIGMAALLLLARPTAAVANALCPPGDVMACAKEAYHGKDLERLYALVLPLAERGDPDMQTLVASLIDAGYGSRPSTWWKIWCG